MIRETTYSNGSCTVVVRHERTDTWMESPDTILNFPGLVVLDGDRLYLTVHRARHGEPDGEPLHGYLSEDGGRSWTEVGMDFPLADASPVDGQNYVDFSNGNYGYLEDGTIARIDSTPVEVVARQWDRSAGQYHAIMQTPDATFRWRRWLKSGKSVENRTFNVAGLPWATGSYESYAKILELGGGEMLTALGVVAGAPRLEGVDERGRPRFDMQFSTAIIRSSDNGQSWEFVTAFHPREHPQAYGISDIPVDEGFDENDLEVLANGDILIVMRSGSSSPMYQSRSSDGGRSWSAPTTTGWPGVKPRLHLLPNGVLACASGRGAYGHPQVTYVMLSLDGTGEHWEYPFAFHTGPGCSYTSTMVRDGMLHVVHSHSDFTRDFGTHGLAVQAIKQAVIGVEVVGGCRRSAAAL